MKPKIYISVSDISSYIGQTSKFPFHLNFERLWKRNDRKDYLKVMHHFKTQSNQLSTTLKSTSNELKNLIDGLDKGTISTTDFTLLQSTLTTKEQLLKERLLVNEDRIDSIHLTERQKINSRLGPSVVRDLVSTTDTHTSKKIKTTALIEKLVVEGVLDSKVITELRQQTTSLINTSHGIQKEASALEQFEIMDNITIDQSQRMVQKHLKSLSDASHFDWFIRGKCDGVYRKEGRLHVVEVKNRVNNLCKSLRNYEITQLQMYLWLIEAKEGILVQQFEGEINVERMRRSESDIEGIFECLYTFLVNFEIQFLGDFDEKVRYVGMNTKERRKFIKKMWTTI